MSVGVTFITNKYMPSTRLEGIIVSIRYIYQNCV